PIKIIRLQIKLQNFFFQFAFNLLKFPFLSIIQFSVLISSITAELKPRISCQFYEMRQLKHGTNNTDEVCVYFSRLTITASCPMNLQYFPMDRQLCHIEIESFGYTMRDIRYKWHDGIKSVGISSEVQLPQFRVLGHRQRATEINLSTGNYSRLACEIQFVRSMGYYLIQIYIPSGLIVIISWVSFWLNRNATPARVALGVTTVLTMTTLMSSTNAALPKISYVKSIDVYLGTCFVMVFASLLDHRMRYYLPSTKAYEQQMQERRQKRDVIPEEFYGTPAMIDRS
ncbi:hypothetical protein L9F63_027285, partial [Diploptera punctata]